jgi:hypothetical protein
MNSLVLQEPAKGDGSESSHLTPENHESLVSKGGVGGYKKQTRRNLLGQIQEEALPAGVGTSTLGVSPTHEVSFEGVGTTSTAGVSPMDQQSSKLNEESDAVSGGLLSAAGDGHDGEGQGAVGIYRSEVAISAGMADAAEDQIAQLRDQPKEIPTTDPDHLDMDKVTGTSLRNLGHSIAESIEVRGHLLHQHKTGFLFVLIVSTPMLMLLFFFALQVLEHFFCASNNRGVSPREAEENASTEARSSGEGEARARAALAELRRIGNILIHIQK